MVSTLLTAEDNLNVSLKDITVTQRDGRVAQLDQVYIRGPMIRFYIVPDMLANAPMCVDGLLSPPCSPGMLILGISTSAGSSELARTP